MSSTAIQWTEHVWNPTVGCSILSPGCTNCYAMNMAARIEAMNLEAEQAGRPIAAPQYDGTTKKVNGHAVWTGKLALSPERVLLQPLKRKKPTVYFVNSMSDLFHESVPDEWIDKVFAVMALCPQHTFQVLTKRAKRMREYFNGPYKDGNGVCARIAEATAPLVPLEKLPAPPIVYNVPVGPRLPNGEPEFGFRRMMSPRAWPLANVWLGVSTERQQEADERIPELLETPAAVRFISAEPLLGPIRLDQLHREGISQTYIDNALDGFRSNGCGGSTGPKLDWVITGGESGPDARPSHPDWFRQIRDACEAASVAYFHKQNGEWAPGECASKPPTRSERGATWFNDKWLFETITPRMSEETHYEDAPEVYRLGKKAAGRHLDGKLHDDMPQRADGKGRG